MRAVRLRPNLSGMLREETDSHVMRLAAKAWRKLRFREQWFIQIELPMAAGLMPDTSRMTPLYPPPDRLWADPFVYSTPDSHFVFVEELMFTAGKGHIAVLELSHDGQLQGVQTVLARPYHLSYPFLFEWEGVLYMMPESGANRSVELYRCEAFPGRWALHGVLLHEVHAADATLVEHDGRWWMFVTQAEDGGNLNEQLYLYSAATPLGPFAPHPGNPVKSGLRGTRPAGALFVHEHTLYRPAQDCSRVYGESVVLHRVESLTPTTYRESEVAVITAVGSNESRRVHTINRGDGIRVLDALRWVAR